jgi:REP element-mobilizing transposase RayT
MAARFPVHVTLKLRSGLPSLRRRREHALLRESFAIANTRAGFRLVHYSVQSNHVHLLCEARDRSDFTLAIQGLAIRIARRLNALWQRTGELFADRYHDHVLRTASEVRNALRYLANNAREHGLWMLRGRNDTYVSNAPLVPAMTWLLSIGWRRRVSRSLVEPPPRFRHT